MEKNECSKLLKEIKNNLDSISKNRNEIELLTSTPTSIVEQPKKGIVKSFEESDEDVKDESDDEALLYYEDYFNLPDNFNYEMMLDILPSRTKINFKSIVLRLQAESIKEIKEIFASYGKHNMSIDDYNDIKELINYEKRKINMLNEIINTSDESIISSKEENKIILVQRSSGTVIVHSDLKKIPEESNKVVLELINSVIDGSFKNIKRLYGNDHAKSIFELKNDDIRLIFNRINRNTYAIITIFMKKTMSDSYYNMNLNSKLDHYTSVKDSIISSLNDEKFLAQNQENIDILFQKLTSKVLKFGKKGDSYNE